MSRKTVGDVMTTPVHAVGLAAGFTEVLHRMRRHQVSVLPVLDARGHVVGVVSEADLLLKMERVELESHKGSLASPAARTARAKAGGTRAGQLMTGQVVTVAADAPLPAAAALMRRRRVRHLLVLDEEARPLGVVSRGDLLTVFARSDDDIRRDVVDGVVVGTLGLDPWPVYVSVSDGVVRLRGQVEHEADVRSVGRLVAEIAGVVDVRNELTYRYGDPDRRPGGPTWLPTGREPWTA
jgi:CBS domain-containing protein